MSILIDGQFTAKAQNAVENAKERLTNGKDVGIVVDRLKKHRSLDANAYFWVLVGKIADKLRFSIFFIEYFHIYSKFYLKIIKT